MSYSLVMGAGPSCSCRRRGHSLVKTMGGVCLPVVGERTLFFCLEMVDPDPWLGQLYFGLTPLRGVSAKFLYQALYQHKAWVNTMAGTIQCVGQYNAWHNTMGGTIQCLAQYNGWDKAMGGTKNFRPGRRVALTPGPGRGIACARLEILPGDKNRCQVVAPGCAAKNITQCYV